MIVELQHAVARYAHALDELNVPELEAVLTEDTTWASTMPGQGVLGLVAGRAAVLDFIRDGHTAQTGRVRHHLGNVVVTTTDAVTAEVRAYPVQTRNTAVHSSERQAATLNRAGTARPAVPGQQGYPARQFVHPSPGRLRCGRSARQVRSWPDSRYRPPGQPTADSRRCAGEPRRSSPGARSPGAARRGDARGVRVGGEELGAGEPDGVHVGERARATHGGGRRMRRPGAGHARSGIVLPSSGPMSSSGTGRESAASWQT
ncbi:SnoaL-like protein [Streptomyces sp. TLI_235]|nr:SnoaL-like protein [Streptomyces sp. TLI_235]